MNLLKLIAADLIESPTPPIEGNALLQNGLNLVYVVIGIVSVVMIIIGGYKYLMSNGDPKKAADGTKTLIFALVGLAVAIFAFTITNFVVDNV